MLRAPNRSNGITRRSMLGALALPLLGAVQRADAQDEPVSEEGFVRIGGIEQWISIRGDSAANPALLFLHGGPGEALSPFTSIFEPWESAFTVVLWDQRGSGKTWGRNPSTPGEMTLERLTQDAIEVAGYALEVLDKDKLVLVGQSWGSIIGWTAARARPDLFHAYVGTGQAVSWAHTVRGQEAHARAEATAVGDEDALRSMDEARDAPLKSFERTAPFGPYIMPPSDLAFIEMQRAYVGPDPFSEAGDVADWVRGGHFSLETLGPPILEFDAYETGIDMPLPVVIIQGTDDRVTPTDAAEALVADVRAPEKHYAEIDGGHFACYMNAEAFTAALVENVMPLIGAPD